MSDFPNLPSLQAALEALHDAIKNPAPQPSFVCPHCANLERSGHLCSSRIDLDAQRRTLDELDRWLGGR